ncbi:MAG TPA: hypothetical protein VHU44_03885 [Acidobacteriaceae bacterium]|jgi:hypothetical protein|nr:hypothetical protein [Acidobacteriaceae bacterium]
MNKVGPIREAWHPQTRHEREAVVAELHAILASPHFCNSKRYPALLRYIVEKALAGEADSLKERTIGVEVFERSPSYDTNADTVVRYTAGEVRKRLALHYHEASEKPAIQISLPPGSYVPEFLNLQEEVRESGGSAATAAHHPVSAPEWVHQPDSLMAWAPQPHPGNEHLTETQAWPPLDSRPARRKRWPIALAGMLCVILLAGFGWKYKGSRAQVPLDRFWTPVLHDQLAIPICIGGSVFSQTHTSGVATATKDIDYPFVSMQSAAAVAQISALLARDGGATAQLQASATTPLNELREHPVVLLGGYNNQWTLRLLQPLRFHFGPPDEGEKIVDAAHPGTFWERDPSMPYSGADDYALVARYHDTTTDSWVVALAGIGRNGTEAAAQFATSPHYMDMLREKLGVDFSTRNVEVVMKVHVIEGKTGAPAIMAVHTW